MRPVLRPYYIYRRRLKSVKLGIAAGFVLGGHLALFNLAHYLFPSYGKLFIAMLSELYPWYSEGLLGSLVLFGFGFLDGFFALWLVGTLYNVLSRSGYGNRSWYRDQKIEKKERSGTID